MSWRPNARLTRRTAIGLLAGLGLSATRLSAQEDSEPVFLSGFRAPDGQFGLATLNAEGRILARWRLPDRGHGVVARPGSSEAVMVARRPGRFALVFDLAKRTQQAMIQAQHDRHFFGHGVFSKDGRLFYATENDVAGERGVIGIYDATDGYRRVGEHSSYGIGPHELVLMPGGEILVIANGGILTHPDLPRAKLNLADMDPSIAFVDRQSGALLAQAYPPADLHRLSLRHLSVNHEGLLAVAAQWEGEESALVPLVALSKNGDPLRLLSAPQSIQRAMRHYCGSVTFNRSGDYFAVSAPRGDTVTIWNAEGSFNEALSLADGCGLAAHGDGFLLTSGRGAVRAGGKETFAPVAWDNHVAAAH